MKTVLSSKGQIVIPAKIRKNLGLKPGMRLAVTQRGGALVLEPESSSFADWAKQRRERGVLKSPLALERPVKMPEAPEL